MVLRRILLLIIGALCVIAGALTLPLPSPTGILLLIGGFALLSANSQTIQDWIYRLRRDFSMIDRGLKAIEIRLPRSFRLRMKRRVRPAGIGLSKAAEPTVPCRETKG